MSVIVEDMQVTFDRYQNMKAENFTLMRPVNKGKGGLEYGHQPFTFESSNAPNKLQNFMGPVNPIKF